MHDSAFEARARNTLQILISALKDKRARKMLQHIAL